MRIENKKRCKKITFKIYIIIPDYVNLSSISTHLCVF